MSVRHTAEHEAAHTVVALAYGIPVHEVLVGPTRGRTRCAAAGTSAQNAAVTAAGDVWEQEFLTTPYRDGCCSDLANLERTVGAEGVWSARRDARAILTRQRVAVLRLADRLERDRHLVLVDSRLVPARV